MIRVRHKFGSEWRDAFLVQVIHDQYHKARFVLAYDDAGDSPARDSKQGMRLFIEDHDYNVRVARRAIPLLEGDSSGDQ